MANAGFATLQVIPSLRGIDSAMQRQLGGKMGTLGSTMGKSASKSFGSSMLSNTGSALDTLGEKITDVVGKAFKKGAKIGIAALSGIAGYALVGGVGRLLATEDATVQLTRMGLGITEIDNLLQGVDQTFQGTPFANPDGFNISSQLFASGRALDEIPGILGNIADLAAHGNVPIDQMGSLFTRIASQGRVTGEELNRLSDANIPLSVLADTMGITVEELRKMASDGKLTSDVFFDAIESVEMFDGAAKAAGDTTRGAFSNVRTALKKLGADFLGPLFGVNGHVVTGLKSMLGWLKGLSPAVKDLGQRFADWLIPAITSVVRGFHAMVAVFKAGAIYVSYEGIINALMQVGLMARFASDAVGKGIQFYKDNADAIGRVLKAAIPAGLGIAGLATAVHLLVGAWKILKIATPIGLLLTLASALLYAWQNSEKFREIVTGAFERIRDVVGPIVETVSGWISNLFGGGAAGGAAGATAKLAGAWERVRKVAATVWPKIQGYISDAVEWIRDNVLPVAQATAKGLVAAFGVVVSWVQNNWPEIQAVIGSVVGWFKTHFGPVIVAAVNLVIAVWNRLVQIAPVIAAFIADVWEKHGARIVAVLSTAWDFIRTYIEVGLRLLRGVIETVTGLINGDWSAAWEAIKSTLVDIWAAIGPTVKAGLDMVVGWIKALPGLALAALGELGGWLAGKGNDLINGLWQGAQSLWDESVKPWLAALPGNMVSLIGDVAATLVQKGRDAFGGLWSGINAVWIGTIQPWLQALPATLLLAVPSLLEALLSRGKQLLNGVMTGIREVWNNTIKPWLAVLGTAALLAVPSLLMSLLSRGKQLLNGVMTGVRDVWNNTLKPWLAALGTAALLAVPGLGGYLAERGKDLIAGAYNGMVGFWNNNFAPWLSALGSKVANAVPNMGGVLYDAGKAVINGLWSGMKAAWGNVTGWLGGLASVIPDWKGPPEKDAKILIENGRLIMQGLRTGLAAGWVETESMLRGMTGSLDTDIRAGAGLAAGGSQATSGSRRRSRDGDVILQSYEQNPTPAGGAAMLRMARAS